LDELELLVSCDMGKDPAQTDLKVIFEEIDKDKSGSITFMEFLRGYGILEQKLGVSLITNKARLESLQQVYEKAANGGSLTYSKGYTEALSDMGKIITKKQILAIEEKFQLKGSITFQQFVQSLHIVDAPKRTISKEEKDRLEKIFLELDVRKQSRITKSRLENFIENSVLKIPKSILDDLFGEDYTLNVRSLNKCFEMVTGPYITLASFVDGFARLHQDIASLIVDHADTTEVGRQKKPRKRVWLFFFFLMVRFVCLFFGQRHPPSSRAAEPTLSTLQSQQQSRTQSRQRNCKGWRRSFFLLQIQSQSFLHNNQNRRSKPSPQPNLRMRNHPRTPCKRN
jgi:Ca2+-binding EF-hand superfamily protein